MCPRSLRFIATLLALSLLLGACARPATTAPRGPERHAARAEEIRDEPGPTHRAPPPEFGNEIVQGDASTSAF